MLTTRATTHVRRRLPPSAHIIGASSINSRAHAAAAAHNIRRCRCCRRRQRGSSAVQRRRQRWTRTRRHRANVFNAQLHAHTKRRARCVKKPPPLGSSSGCARRARTIALHEKPRARVRLFTAIGCLWLASRRGARKFARKSEVAGQDLSSAERFVITNTQNRARAHAHANANANSGANQQRRHARRRQPRRKNKRLRSRARFCRREKPLPPLLIARQQCGGDDGVDSARKSGANDDRRDDDGRTTATTTTTISHRACARASHLGDSNDRHNKQQRRQRQRAIACRRHLCRSHVDVVAKAASVVCSGFSLCTVTTRSKRLSIAVRFAGDDNKKRDH